MRNHITGTRSEGSIFIVLQSFIPNIDIPELAISIPPIIDISVRRSGDKNAERNPANKYIEPCQQKRTAAAIAIPTP